MTKIRVQLLIDAAAKHVPLKLATHVVNNAMSSVLISEQMGDTVTRDYARRALLSSFESPGTLYWHEAFTRKERDAAIEAVLAEWDSYEAMRDRVTKGARRLS